MTVLLRGRTGAFDEATERELEKLRAKASGAPAARIEPHRRHTDKPDMNPGAVRGLAPDHPAMTENRTLFPSTVVEVTEEEPERLLVSGANNRKLGDVGRSVISPPRSRG